MILFIMRPVKRVFVAAFIAAAVSAVMFGLASERAAEDSPSNEVESFMEGLKVNNRIEGRRQWTLSADRASFSEETAGLQSVTLDLPGEEMTVRSDSGTYSMETGDLRLEGNVKAETPSYAIKTAKLDIYKDGGEVRSGEPVIVESSSFRINGEGLHMQNNMVRLLRDVRAEFY